MFRGFHIPDMNLETDRSTRRQLLTAAAAGTALLAGCIGDSGDGDGGNDTDNGDSGDDTGAPDGNTTNSTDTDDTGETTAATVPVRGDPEAAVTLEVYEDLGCPACRSYVQNGLPQLEAGYIDEGQIRYEHRDFPVTGPAAEQAASAAREVLARHGNDAFWEFVSAVFANQGRLGQSPPDLFEELAGNLGFDADAVATAGQERSHQSVVERDITRGEELGVEGTPSFVVDDQLVDTSGARSIDAVADALDTALAGGDGGDDDSSGSDDDSTPY
jgi:protein-disulfide isomerase